MRHENHLFTTDLAPSLALGDGRPCFCEGGGSINPGDWMVHCHVTDHQTAGMMAVIRIGDGLIRK
ncbi:multicopper oxidase domain-containing protein [Reyranella sp.]|uniref:multicopper oxidase domain-containing protein n=1 Tax=Reyranella sp. TaxID=1929291 RepID=UPI00120E1843|nr:multicopper oxidase domain-containing protein [Reyranella sp.]TAJ81795.1 MAG: hypothetical protein EPO50_28705 [Reyranella sp.]